MTLPDSPELLGVRHHGPGSARAVRAALEASKPGIVLIEGPPEADELIHLVPRCEPPVALLAYVAAEPRRAAFWPFAAFSPEWQAIQYALGAGIPARFFDLPAAHTLAGAERHATAVQADPLGTLAEAAGYDDAERWWDDVVEHRETGAFEAIAEAMTELRAGHDPDEHEARREAYMRRMFRRAMREHERVAVVCGAWHIPALRDMPTAAADDRLLRGLPKTKVAVTWAPWTHGRLASWSGYGAGVLSPGWYHHLFTARDRPIERWLADAARVLRDEGIPVSSAHVLESVRLAHTLAALRDRPLAGLAEVSEATLAVLCEGSELAVDLVQRRLVVGERLGSVPADTPMVPLQRHLREQQKASRLKPEAVDRELELDLRKPLDLRRSVLLHRLLLIGVGWGQPGQARGKGTFREVWRLRWRPELDVDLIEASAWGTTVDDAAVSRSRDLAAKAVSLADLTGLAERCLLADLPDALPLAEIRARAALDTDVGHLMAALPAVVRASRYGDVRGTDLAALRGVIDELVVRICVDLPPAVTGLDEDAARAFVGHIDGVHTALGLIEGHRDRWLDALAGVAGRADLHGMLAGRLARLLLDARRIEIDQAAAGLSRAVSIGSPPSRAAAWVEGFLSGGGLLLVHDPALLGLIDTWLAGLPQDAFADVLPLLRRTFGAFAGPERRAIGERVRSPSRAAGAPDLDVDMSRAAPAVRTVELILGVPHAG